MDLTKQGLARTGLLLAQRFLSTNEYTGPSYDLLQERRIRFGACGYFDSRVGSSGKVVVAIPLCAHRNPKFSWPGFISDRTPLGVIAHETGHFIDWQNCYPAGRIRQLTGEKAITSYAPNAGEWFAEMMRLFITNPGLLKLIRPKTYKELTAGLRLQPVVTENWRKVLAGAEAPEQVLARIRRFIPT